MRGETFRKRSAARNDQPRVEERLSLCRHLTAASGLQRIHRCAVEHAGHRQLLLLLKGLDRALRGRSHDSVLHYACTQNLCQARLRPCDLRSATGVSKAPVSSAPGTPEPASAIPAPAVSTKREAVMPPEIESRSREPRSGKQRPLHHRTFNDGAIHHRPLDDGPVHDGPVNHRSIDDRTIGDRTIDHRSIDGRTIGHGTSRNRARSRRSHRSGWSGRPVAPHFSLPIMVPPRTPVVIPAPIVRESIAPAKIEERSVERKLILGFVMPTPEPAASPAPRLSTTPIIRERWRRRRLLRLRSAAAEKSSHQSADRGRAGSADRPGKLPALAPASAFLPAAAPTPELWRRWWWWWRRWRSLLRTARILQSAHGVRIEHAGRRHLLLHLKLPNRLPRLRSHNSVLRHRGIDHLRQTRLRRLHLRIRELRALPSAKKAVPAPLPAVVPEVPSAQMRCPVTTEMPTSSMHMNHCLILLFVSYRSICAPPAARAKFRAARSAPEVSIRSFPIKKSRLTKSDQLKDPTHAGERIFSMQTTRPSTAPSISSSP